MATKVEEQTVDLVTVRIVADRTDAMRMGIDIEVNEDIQVRNLDTGVLLDVRGMLVYLVDALLAEGHHEGCVTSNLVRAIQALVEYPLEASEHQSGMLH